MILGAQIGMLIFGLVALCTGKLTLTKARVVQGLPARMLGIVAMLPLPLALMVGVAVFLALGIQNVQQVSSSVRLTMSLVDAGIVVGCLAAVYGFGVPIAKRQEAEREAKRAATRDDNDGDWQVEVDDRRSRARRPEPLPAATPLPPPLPAPPHVTTPVVPASHRFNCTACGGLMEVKREHAGLKVRCPKCQAVIVAPAPPPPPAPIPITAVTAAPPLGARDGITARAAADASPPSLPRPSGDDEDERRRRRPGRDLSLPRPSSPVGLIVGLIVGGVVLLVVIVGVLAWAMHHSAPGAEEQLVIVRKDGGKGVDVGKDKPPKDGDRRDEPMMKKVGDKVVEPPPPVGRLELPPLPDPIDIKPAPIKAETSYKLPEPAASLRVGGGGRFLILHFPQVRKLGIFDASEAKIVRSIPCPEDDIVFAGGMTQLVLYLPGSQIVQRYNLLTGDREYLGKFPLPEGKVEAFCMGHASAGPLLVGVAGQGARLYDIDRFEEIPLPEAEPRPGFGQQPGPARLDEGNYWAGATGRVFGHTGNRGQPNGVNTVILGGGKVQRFGEHQGTWFVMPGPDDRHIYPGGHGVVSDRVKPVPNVPFSMGPGAGFASHLYLPAHHGPYYLHAQTIEDFGGKGGPPQGTVRLFLLGDKEPIATYRNTAVCKYGWEGLRGLRIEHSLHLIPQAKLLVIVPESRDELRLYPADLEAALDATGRDYLVFTSKPPTTFQHGKAFTYQVVAKANKGPVMLKLESGPAGMQVDKAGAITWAPPANLADERVDVILSARSAGGQETFQTFTLTRGP